MPQHQSNKSNYKPKASTSQQPVELRQPQKPIPSTISDLPVISTIEETPDYAPDYLPVVSEEVENIENVQLEIDENSDESQTLMDLATAYINMGDEKEAKEVLIQAVEKSSGNTRVKAQRMLDSLD